MKIKKILFRSFSSTINSFYILLIALVTLISGSTVYFYASSQLNENTSEAMDGVLNQKVEYLSFMYQDIFEQFYNLTSSMSVSDLANAGNGSVVDFVDLTNEAESLFNYNSYFIDSVYININGLEITQSEQQVFNSADSIDYADYVSQANREGYFWITNQENNLFSGQQDIQTVGYIVENFSGEPVGLMLMNLNLNFINTTLTELSLENSYMMLLSDRNYYVPENEDIDTQLNELIFDRYQANELSADRTEFSRSVFDSYYIQYETIGTNKWELALVTPKPDLFSSSSSVIVLVILFSGLLFILAGIFLRLVRRYISNPILKLANNMITTETYHEKLDMPEVVPDELKVLYETYNDLIDRNVLLIDQVTSEQKEKMELEVALLQAQISPHFLYNTLYSIKGLSDMGMSDEASQMTSKLSDFFRTSLSRGKEVIYIKDELENIKSYLYIMETRYGDFFDYDITIPESLYPYMIVKLSLQPIIENAIYHGVMNDRKDGKLVISGTEHSDYIELTVHDNGKGIEPEKLERLQTEIKAPYLTSDKKEVGVGLRSVDIRIRNRYGNKYGLQIESQMGEYTKVSIRIPKIRGEEHV